MKHVVQFSGGVSSWAAARVVRDSIMAEDDEIVLLFADTLIEDRDTYLFLDYAAADIGVPLTRICEEMTPWDMFKHQGFLGNSRVDPCSKFLKRIPLRQWIEANCEVADTVIYLGIDWTETHRLDRARPRWEPWRLEAPLIDLRVDKAETHRWAEEHGLPSQRLYEMGMPHANCGGGCVKAGQGHFLKLLREMPERFAEWERNEADVAAYLGKPVSILRVQKDKVKTPITLAQLRQRQECGDDAEFDPFDYGGCGCAID